LDAAKNEDAAHKVLNNALYKQLSTTLSGSQEFTSLTRLYEEVQSGEYDLVILDTPPAQHAVDFLQAPQKIFALFQKSIVRWFVAPKMSKSWASRVISKSTQSVFLALEKVTGADFIGQLAEFFDSVQSIQEKISQRSIDTHRLLMQSNTGFVVVTSFDQSKMQEAEEFYKDLKRSGYNMSGLVVNRALPEWSLDDSSWNCPSAITGEEWVSLKDCYSEVSQYYKDREAFLQSLSSTFNTSITVQRVPELIGEVTGLSGLTELSKSLESEDHIQ
jgi:anion-transporting  ArsA/GET3 family ATPase